MKFLIYIYKINAFYQKLNFLKEKNNFLNFILLNLILLLLHFYWINKKRKNFIKLFEKQEYIFNNITPQKAIVEDILIYEITSYDSDNMPNVRYRFFPIVRSFENGKRYITYGKHSLSCYTYSWTNRFGPLTFSIEGINGEKIDIDSYVNLYILKEINPSILRQNNQIELLDCIFPYKGNLYNNSNEKKFTFGKMKSGVYNLNHKIDFLGEPIIYFEGLIDFDEQSSFEKYKVFLQKNLEKNKKNAIVSIPIIPIISFIILAPCSVIFSLLF